MPWVTINGRKVWIEPKRGISSSDVPDPRNPHKVTSSHFDDEYNRRRLEEFAREKKEEFEKMEKERIRKEPQSKFDKAIRLNLGSAQAFLIKATPTLLRLDPTLSSIYTGYQVSKYGYCFLKKVNENYQTNGSYEESLKTVAKQEVEEKIISKVKLLALDKGSHYAANGVWAYCKETYSNGNMDPKWDEFGEKALAKTFEEVGGMLL